MELPVPCLRCALGGENHTNPLVLGLLENHGSGGAFDMELVGAGRPAADLIASQFGFCKEGSLIGKSSQKQPGDGILS